MNQIKTGLQLGDRLPNFMRNDQDNKPFVLYGDACAKRLLLLLVPDPKHPALAAELKLMTDPGVLPDDVTRLGMICGDPELAAEFSQRHKPGFSILADDGEIIKFLLGQSNLEGLHAFVTDANAHLIGRLEASREQPPTIANQAAQIFQQWQLPKPRIITAQAPILFIPQVFEPDFCAALIEAFKQRGSEPSGVLKVEAGKMVYETQNDTKIRREHRVVDNDLRAAIETRLAERVLPEIEWAYNFKATSYEGIKILLYDADSGGHFVAHRDNDGPDTAHRRFAMTLNLNTEQYQGGELRFPEYSHDLYKPASGGAAIFSCSLAHEALPVTSGQRYAVVVFFSGGQDKFKKAAFDDRVRPER